MQLAEVLQLEPHQLVKRKYALDEEFINHNIRFTQRGIDSLVTENRTDN